MIKKIGSHFRKQYKLVKKYSNRIEAQLAKELLEVYHIHAYVLLNYFGQMTALFVRPYDYPKAVQLLIPS